MLESDPARRHAPSDAGDAVWPPLDEPSELIQRLRILRWPEVSPEARQRCWTEIALRVESLSEGAVNAEPAGRRRLS